jgi:hypothetical protein
MEVPMPFLRRSLLASFLLGTSLLTSHCTLQKSKTNDVTIGNIVVDDDFVSKSTWAIIEGALAKGCDDFEFNPSTRTLCANAFTRLTELLDFRAATSGENSAFVFLHSQLLKNVTSEVGKKYLGALSGEISKAYTTGATLRVWDFTLSHFKGDKSAAIEHIASLFQDTLPDEVQTKWLFKTGEADATPLANILVDLEYLQKNSLISYFPVEVESKRSAFYHFYIPMYLAHKMKFHYTKKEMAFLTAFLFNARYEFRQIWENAHPEDKVKYNVQGGFALRKALVEDLIAHLKGPILPFDATKEAGNFEDLYLGYAGAKMGAEGVFSKEDSDAFKKFFASNPMGFIKASFSDVK